MLKYALHPGQVSSLYDSERHYISAAEPANLYGVRMEECFVVKHPKDILGKDLNNFIHLYPQRSGDYSLPIMHGDLKVTSKTYKHSFKVDKKLATGALYKSQAKLLKAKK